MRRLTDPIAQRRTIALDPVPRVESVLPIQRADDRNTSTPADARDVCCGTTTRCRHRRRRCLGDDHTPCRRICRAMPNHLEAAGNVVEDLGDVLAELRHAILGSPGRHRRIGLGLVDNLLSRAGDRATACASSCAGGSVPDDRPYGLDDIPRPRRSPALQAAIRAARLADLDERPNCIASLFGDLELQLLDLQRGEAELQDNSAAFNSGLTGQRSASDRQAAQPWPATCNDLSKPCDPPSKISTNRCLVRPALRAGSGGATVLRQSIASISSANCAGVSVIAPSTIGGHTTRPLLQSLRNRHRPLPSRSTAPSNSHSQLVS